MKPAYILGAGLHTALGRTPVECVNALRHSPPKPTMIDCKLSSAQTIIPYFLLSGCQHHDVQVRIHDIMLGVIGDAIADAGLTPEQLQKTGLLLGSSSFEIAEEEERFAKALEEDENAFALRECGMGNLAERIRQHFGLYGSDFSFNTACTASANTVWYAAQLIDAGEIDHALVVAVEFANDTTTYGFQGLQLLTADSMKPFHNGRDGLMLGESCAAVVLGATRSEKYRTAITGGANLCDTYSMSVTREDGVAVSEVIGLALENANISADVVKVVKCHGTSTPSGDHAEATGTLQVFANPVIYSALKPYVGHTLGACGLTELLLFCGAAEQGFIPGLPNLQRDDDDTGIHIATDCTAFDCGYSVLNYFGFGGNNTSLVIHTGDEQQ